MKKIAKFRQLEDVNVKVFIRGYDRKLDCIQQTEAFAFTEIEKQQLIRLTEKFLKRRVKMGNKKVIK